MMRFENSLCIIYYYVYVRIVHGRLPIKPILVCAMLSNANDSNFIIHKDVGMQTGTENCSGHVYCIARLDGEHLGISEIGLGTVVTESKCWLNTECARQCSPEINAVFPRLQGFKSVIGSRSWDTLNGHQFYRISLDPKHRNVVGEETTLN